MKRAALALTALLFASIARPDALSTDDKLRVVYSNQFAWTKDGKPIVTVRIAEGRDQVTILAPGGQARLLPDGEGGAEIAAGRTWTVHVENGRPSKVRWHVVVARLRPGDARLGDELAAWRTRGFAPRTFEIGALYGIKGQVLDSRRILVAIEPHDTEVAARSEATALAARFHVETGVHPELVERPRGEVIATDERGVVVKNGTILWFAPQVAGGLLTLENVDKEGGGREDRRYFGKLYATVDSHGRLAVVNAVPADKLLAGLVPAEMMPSAPLEALKAQAVAARNELLAKIGTRHLTEPYRLCSTQHCQVYAGAGREDPRATRAVAETVGELLVRDPPASSAKASTNASDGDDGGGLVDAVYSASCGGHGEDNDLAWGGAPDSSLRGGLDGDAATRSRLARFARLDACRAPCNDPPLLDEWLKEGAGPNAPFCARPKAAAKSFRWQQPIDLARAAARAGVGPLSDLQVLARGVSGRVTRLRLVGKSGSREAHGELEVRRALGNLKSAMFVLALTRGTDGRLTQAVATGGGHGHGIGMCQLGAVGMAEAGATYKQILEHYYPASHVRRLY